jgi:putative membrane protein
MDRRTILLAAGATMLAAHPLIAQTRGPAPALAGNAAEAGPAEKAHIQDTMKVGALALATSRLALDKAKNSMLKQFAKFEVAEQETIAEIIKTMQGANLSAAGEGAAPNAEATAQMDDKAKQTLDKLKSLKAGAEFDNEYIKGQIDGHQMLLKAQETYITSGKLREQINIAKLARGQIKEHLTLLDHIKSQVKSG